MAPIKVAVLDDYQNISAPHFAALDPAQFEVTIFRDTLLPYNHPDTPWTAKEELVKRLEPFTIICTMRERTPFPAELIAKLPHLQLLLTTGLRNASIDLAACNARGIPVAGAKDTPVPAEDDANDVPDSPPQIDATTTTATTLTPATATNPPPAEPGSAPNPASSDPAAATNPPPYDSLTHPPPEDAAANSVPAGHHNPNAKVGTDSTTEHTLSLILALARGVVPSHNSVVSGGWQTDPALPLSNRTLGVVGLGRLGVAVARICHLAFHMRVVAWSPNLTQPRASAAALHAGLPALDPLTGNPTFECVSREALFAEADVVSVHMVLSDQTRGLITGADLGRMKSSALFVNTARAPLVVEKDLLDVLQKGKIGGAALDVFELEPLPRGSPWRTTPWGAEGRSKVLLTPHMGYVEKGTLDGWYRWQVENVRRWRRGEELALRLHEAPKVVGGVRSGYLAV